MSPIYEYKCEECGRSFESVHRICERDTETCCGKKATLLISTASKPVVYEYFSENLNAQITGPKQRERLMREKGVECVG